MIIKRQSNIKDLSALFMGVEGLLVKIQAVKIKHSNKFSKSKNTIFLNKNEKRQVLTVKPKLLQMDAISAQPTRWLKGSAFF